MSGLIVSLQSFARHPKVMKFNGETSTNSTSADNEFTISAFNAKKKHLSTALQTTSNTTLINSLRLSG